MPNERQDERAAIICQRGLQRRLSQMSVTAVQDFYRTAYLACQLDGDRELSVRSRVEWVWTRSLLFVERVTDLSGQIRGMRSRICPDMWVTDLAGWPGPLLVFALLLRGLAEVLTP